MYPVTQNYLTVNRSKRPLTALGALCHATATPGATDEREQAFFNSGYRAASAHTFIDWDSITETIPWAEQAGHAGPTANTRFIGVELCEPYDSDPDRFTKFAEVWKRGVWYFADMFVKKGWTTEQLHSHKWVSETYRETDHTDPYEYFKKYGKTFQDFNDDVDAEIERIKKGVEDVAALDKAILVYSYKDLWAAEDVDTKLGGVANFTRQGTARTVPAAALAATKLYIIGGPDVPTHPNRVYMSGNDKFDTAVEVGKALKDGRV